MDGFLVGTILEVRNTLFSQRGLGGGWEDQEVGLGVGDTERSEDSNRCNSLFLSHSEPALSRDKPLEEFVQIG